MFRNYLKIALRNLLKMFFANRPGLLGTDQSTRTSGGNQISAETAAIRFCWSSLRGGVIPNTRVFTSGRRDLAHPPPGYRKLHRYPRNGARKSASPAKGGAFSSNRELSRELNPCLVPDPPSLTSPQPTPNFLPLPAFSANPLPLTQ